MPRPKLTDAQRRERERERKARQRKTIRDARVETGLPTRATRGCPACAGRTRYHDCEDFPLPTWARDYLRAFDAFLAAPDGQSAQVARIAMTAHLGKAQAQVRRAA